MSDIAESAAKIVFAMHLAEGYSVLKAAKHAEIDAKLAHQWERDPMVVAELGRIQADLRKRLYRRLAALGDSALEAYERALGDRGERPPSQPVITAARDVLDRLGLGKEALAEYLGHPDEPVTIVVPVAVNPNARAEQDARRAARVERQREAGLYPEVPPA